MNVVYVCSLSKTDSGVIKKVKGQIKEWVRIGHTVTLINVGHVTQVEINSVSVYEYNLSFIGRIFDYKLLKILTRVNPDLVYYRFGPVSTALFFVRKCPVVLELNTAVDKEKRSKPFLKRLSATFYKYIFNRISKMAIGVTPECLEGFESIDSSFVIGNGVEFDSSLFDSATKTTTRRAGVLFIGSEGHPWHGVDRILDIAKSFPDIDFHFIGYSNVYIHEEFDISEAPLNCHLHGFLSGVLLDDFLISCKVAIGSMAMDRLGFMHSSSLKNRMYLQYGLPIIIQGIDQSFEELEMVKFMPVQFELKDFETALQQFLNLEINGSHKEAIRQAISTEFIEPRRLQYMQNTLNEFQSN